MTAWLTVSLLTALAAGPADDAVAAERDAFRAVDEERWCDAARHFSLAHQLAPSATLLENAAEAAISAGDHEWAALLLRDAAALAPRARRNQLRQRANASKSQPTSTRCPRAVAPDEEAALKPAPDQPGRTSVADEVDPPSAPDASSATPALSPEPPAGGSSTPIIVGTLGGVGLAVGGLMGALGAALGGVAAIPWLAFATAQEDIRQAESRGDSAADAQLAQAESRAQWESWGAPLAVVGPVLAAGGVALLMLGGGMLTTGLVLGGEEPE